MPATASVTRIKHTPDTLLGTVHAYEPLVPAATFEAIVPHVVPPFIEYCRLYVPEAFVLVQVIFWEEQVAQVSLPFGAVTVTT